MSNHTTRAKAGSREWHLHNDARWWRRHYNGKFGRHPNVVVYNNCVIGTTGHTRDESIDERKR